MTIEDLLKAIDAEGANRGEILAAYLESETTGLVAKNSELIGKLKDAKAAADALQIDHDAEIKAKEKDMAPLELQLSRLVTDMDSMKAERDTAIATAATEKAATKKAQISQALRSAMVKLSMADVTAGDQVQIHAGDFDIDKSGSIVTTDGNGLTVDKWAAQLKVNRPDLWPASKGAGATGGSAGSNGVNPWEKGHINMTKQGEVYRDDPAKAEQLAASAGVTITGKQLN